jgi:hypothetical protein
MSVAIRPTDFDITSVSFGKFWKNPGPGPSNVYTNYGPSKKNLRVVVPRSRVAFGPSEYDSVSIDLDPRNPKSAPMASLLTSIETLAIDYVFAHRDDPAYAFLKMAGKNRDFIAEMYSKNPKPTKPAKEGVSYPPTFNVKIPKVKDSEEFNVELYNADKTKIEDKSATEVLGRGAEISMIIECKGLWLKAQSYGIKWNLIQARIDVPAVGDAPVGCAIPDDDEETVPVKATNSASAPAKAVLSIPDDEEEEEVVLPAEVEEEEEEEIEVVQPPPPPPAKKKALGGAKKAATAK